MWVDDGLRCEKRVEEFVTSTRLVDLLYFPLSMAMTFSVMA